MAVRAADGRVLARDVTVADHFGARLLGLMGRSRLDPDEGLWLVPCNSVQMFFMRTPLDIAYLDRKLRVVSCVPEMREWRFKLLPVRHAHSALELAPGSLARHGVKEGDQLSMDADLVFPIEAAPEPAPASAGTFSANPGSSQ
ncbi:MAG TPA: DUF192 domain-containing protein [Candidatus Dormibacteraeota bacterium]|nr:DUF192 domain-containing protein [Candidatus Dormibacteraeota bacterium]